MRYCYLPWLLLSLFSVLGCRSQSRSQLLKEFREADVYYRKALALDNRSAAGEARESQLNQIALQKFRQLEKRILSYPGSMDSLSFFLSLKTAELAHYFDSLPLALHYYTKALSLQAALPAPPADSLIFRTCLFAGQIYFYQNQWDSAHSYFKKAEQIGAHSRRPIQESERLYNSLGVLYFQVGNYLQAANYFQEAADRLDKTAPHYQDFRINYHINYAIALFKLEDYGKAYTILERLLPYRTHTNEIYNNLGLIEARQGRFQQAIGQYRKVVYNNALAVGLENDKAGAWLSLKQYDSARSCLNTALNDHKKYNGSQSSTDHGLTLKNLGDLESALHHYPAALSYYQKALIQFYPSFRDSSLYANPAVFSGVFSYTHLFHTLVAKAGACHALYLASHHTKWAEEELRCFEAAFKLISYTERMYESDEARLFLQKSRDLIHGKPVEIAVELYRRTKDRAYLEKAFQLDQRSKASVLVFNDQRNQRIQPSSSLRQKELALKREITRLSLTAGNTPGTVNMKETGHRIRELEIRLGKVQEAIARTYPAVNTAVPPVADLQKGLLDAQTKLISYHLGEHTLTTFSITTTDFSAQQQPVYPGFPDDLQAFVRQLHTPSETAAADARGERLSLFLLHGLPDRDHRRLIIIPDNELSYLPFEVLKQKNAYLAADFSVQYQYSTALLKKETMNFKETSTLSFAPFTKQGYSGDGMELDRLVYSPDEIKDLEGTAFTGMQATKKNFLTHANGNQIIHLATHAAASDDPDTPAYIVFAPWHAATRSDYLLYGPEVYNLSLKGNQLIILSACETGYGKLVRGEGVMSLSRAFAYAGCPNIITSLWKADDQATALLVRKIHAYLHKGLAIDEAVHRAKKDYLSDDRINPRMKQPAYWANLVFIGNYKATTASFPWMGILGGTACVAAIWGLARKTARKKHPAAQS